MDSEYISHISNERHHIPFPPETRTSTPSSLLFGRVAVEEVLNAFGAGEYPVFKEDLEEVMERLPKEDAWNRPNAVALQAVINGMSDEERLTVSTSL